MRIIVLGLATLLVVLGAGVQPSDAQQKRRATWCHTPDPGSPPECLYHSLEQCLASASGVGGSCDPNYPASAWGRGDQQFRQPQPQQRQRQQRQERDWRW